MNPSRMSSKRTRCRSFQGIHLHQAAPTNSARKLLHGADKWTLARKTRTRVRWLHKVAVHRGQPSSFEEDGHNAYKLSAGLLRDAESPIVSSHLLFLAGRQPIFN